MYILSPMAIRFVPVDTFFTIPDLVKALIKAKLNVIKYEFDEYWLAIEQLEQLEEANNYFKN